MILSEAACPPEVLLAQTGWEIKPQGACKGELCVPLPLELVGRDGVAVDVLAQRLGMAVVRDEAAGLWAIGPETLTGRTLLDARAPNLTLPDWRGGEYSLSSSRGRKVIMVAWASW